MLCRAEQPKPIATERIEGKMRLEMRTHKLPAMIVAGLLLAVAVCLGPAAAEGAGEPQDAARAALLDANIHAQAVAALEANPELQRNPFAVLVKFQPGASDVARAAARAAAGANTMRRYAIVPGLELVHTTLTPEAAVAALRAMPGVAYAEPDYVVRTSEDPPQLIPKDYWGFEREYQWGCHNTGQVVYGGPGTPGADVNAPEAWWISTGDPNFVIAMVDTGIEYTHLDLAANMWVNPGEIPGDGIDNDGNRYVDDVQGWDFYSQDNDPMDENGHGTHTAGTVGARGNNIGEEAGFEIGVAGMMWECKLMPLRFLGPGGSGLISDAVLALQYATEKGVKVSNNSWGSRSYSSSLYDAIEAAQAMGHIVVAAAGNFGKNIDARSGLRWKLYPAAYDLDNIISVAATDKDDGLPRWSNYGLTSVDLGAPGDVVISTFLTQADDFEFGDDGVLAWGGPLQGWYAWGSGTSMAAPHVSGVVGLVYAENPGWTYQQVRTQVIDTARPVASLAGKTVSGGVVDAALALGVYVPPPPPPGCGDGSCDQGETPCDCPEDCGDPPPDETGLCNDGEDNDCDDATDCDDADCDGDPACPDCLPKNARCSTDEECCSGVCKRNGRCR